MAKDELKCLRCGSNSIEKTKSCIRIFLDLKKPQPDGICLDCGAPCWKPPEEIIFPVVFAIKEEKTEKPLNWFEEFEKKEKEKESEAQRESKRNKHWWLLRRERKRARRSSMSRT
ncbi:MAG: hypothetical protein ABIA08_00980 [bacterium]